MLSRTLSRALRGSKNTLGILTSTSHILSFSPTWSLRPTLTSLLWGLTGTSWRGVGWWLPPPPPPRGGDDFSGWDDGDYVYKMKLETGQNYKYEVKIEGREVMIRGRVSEHTALHDFHHSFTRTHVLPDNVDLETLRAGFNNNGEFVITAKYYRKGRPF